MLHAPVDPQRLVKHLNGTLLSTAHRGAPTDEQDTIGHADSSLLRPGLKGPAFLGHYPTSLRRSQAQPLPYRLARAVPPLRASVRRALGRRGPLQLINDRYGRNAGDEALEVIARTLADNARQGDQVIRWGGEGVRHPARRRRRRHAR
ncbi:MAG: diguanylate cyclase domain-containing protein [Solirubrobacteraceae bacterium]